MSDTQMADVINDAAVDPAPEMEPAPRLDLDLIYGIEIDGEWVTTATVRELNGEDEEILSPLGTDDELLYTDYVTAILERAVVSIGDHPVTKSLLEDLTLGDRDTLFLHAIRVSYGMEREVQALCPNCNESNDIVIELDEDFPLHPPTFDPQEGILVEGKRDTYRLRLPTGKDMVVVQGDDVDSIAKFNTSVLAQCVVFGDDAPEDKVAWAKSLNLSDRKLLIDTLLKTRVGPELEEVDAQCAACQEEIRLVLDWASLLLG